ncbi:MAG TPA: thermonuclease family protein [Dehalococcoidia bacterium]|nr:thermonuclease family protein [Dehalococcoidia bacterium]
MPMTLIQGDFQALNGEPDGDSIRFYPTNVKDWDAIPGPHKIRPNHSGGAQLRFDGVDALETHYPSLHGGLGITHQPPQFAGAAAARVLSWLGFKGVTRSADQKVTASTPTQAPGYILSRTADKYGRCVAFVFKGRAPARSSSLVNFGVPMLRQSLNYDLLVKGMAYPTFYTKLYPDIRRAMTAAVAGARQKKTGLWPSDETTKGFRVASANTLENRDVIMPKLFRRLVDYLAINDGNSSLRGFKNYLASKDDRLFVISTGHSTGFDYVVDVQGQRVNLTRPPEDLLFVEG